MPPPKKDKKKTVREVDVEQPLLLHGNFGAASTDASGGSSPTRQRRITIEDAESLKIITPGGDPSAAASAASAALSARLLADAATNNRGRLDCSSILLLALVSTVCGAAGGVLAQGDAAANLRQLIADGGTTLLIVVGAVGLAVGASPSRCGGRQAQSSRPSSRRPCRRRRGRRLDRSVRRRRACSACT